MFHFMNFVRPFVNYAIFRVISEGLNIAQKDDFKSFIPEKITTFLGANSA